MNEGRYSFTEPNEALHDTIPCPPPPECINIPIPKAPLPFALRPTVKDIRSRRK